MSKENRIQKLVGRIVYKFGLVHVPNFGRYQGRRTGVAVTIVSNSLILGGWVTKVLKNGDKKWGGGGGRVGDNILTFCPTVVNKKMPRSCLFLHKFAYSLN